MAVENSRKLKMKFKTAGGDDHNIILSYVKDGLKTGEGAALVKTAMQKILDEQPLSVTIARSAGAEVVETTTTDVELD